MATAGQAIVLGNGKRGVLPSGRAAVANAAGQCPECCGGGCLDNLSGEDWYLPSYPGIDSAAAGYKIDWTTVGFAGDETSYTVESSPDGSTWSEVATGITDDWYHGETAPDTTAYYRVKSVGGATTEYACPVVVTTDKAPTLAAPTVSDQGGGTLRIDLSGYTDTGSGEHDWRPHAGTEYDSVEILYSDTGSSGPWLYLQELSGIGDGIPPHYDDTTVGSGNTRWYRVRAINYGEGSGTRSAMGIGSPAASGTAS